MLAFKMSSESAATSPVSRLPIVLIGLPIVPIGVILLGCLARLVWLDRLPGIDGDEAWYGVNVQVFRDGGVPFWRKSVGNPLNPFHSLPLLALSYVMAARAPLLRAPEVIWGILAIAIAYPMFAGGIGRRGAALVAVLLALSPAAIAYSRFGWDPSGTPLACVLALGFAFRQQPVAAAISSLGAIVIHPTNIFIVPIVLSVFAPALHRRYRALSSPARRRLQLGAGLLVALVTPLALWVLDTLATRPNTTIPSVEIVLQRAFTPGAWAATATGALRMFSGATTITDMAGPLPALALTALDVVAIAVLVCPVLLALVRFRSARPNGDSPVRFFGGDRPQSLMWLSAGFLASLAAFHIVAGPTALMPGRERYGAGVSRARDRVVRDGNRRALGLAADVFQGGRRDRGGLVRVAHRRRLLLPASRPWRRHATRSPDRRCRTQGCGVRFHGGRCWIGRGRRSDRQ